MRLLNFHSADTEAAPMADHVQGASQPHAHPYHTQYAGPPHAPTHTTHLHLTNQAQSRPSQFNYMRDSQSQPHPYSFPAMPSPANSTVPRITTPTSSLKMSSSKPAESTSSKSTPLHTPSTAKGKNKDREKIKVVPKQTQPRVSDPPLPEMDDPDDLLDPAQEREREKERERAQQKARRTWKACETCRKRKIKCDGGFPCGFCEANDKLCDCECCIPVINGWRGRRRHGMLMWVKMIYLDTDKTVTDNAATHRAQAAAVSDRLIRMEEMLERLLPLLDMVEALSGDSTLSSGIKQQKRQLSLGSPPLRSIEDESDRIKLDPSSEAPGHKRESSGMRLMGKGSSRSGVGETDDMNNAGSSPWDHVPTMTGDFRGSVMGGYVSLSCSSRFVLYCSAYESIRSIGWTASFRWTWFWNGSCPSWIRYFGNEDCISDHRSALERNDRPWCFRVFSHDNDCLRATRLAHP